MPDSNDLSQTVIDLTPDELAIIQSYREQLEDYRHRPTHFILKFDIDPERVLCTMERKSKASRYRIIRTAQTVRGSVRPG